MPRDKFAAMASRAKMTNATVPESDVGNSSRTASRQLQQQGQLGAPPSDLALHHNQEGDDPSTAKTASPPKRDKLAALAARSNKSTMEIYDDDGSTQTNQQKNHVSSSATLITSPPKRDKMAALAARSNTASSEPNKLNAEVMQIKKQQAQQNSGKPATNISAISRRNKLAALASHSMNKSSPEIPPLRTVPSRNNKLAKLAAANQTSGSTSSETAKTKSKKEIAIDVAMAKEKYLEKLQERLSKRKGILSRLDRAEKLTCKLLKIAAETTDSLQELSYSTRLSKLSTAYRSTIQEVHPLLTMGTEELIKPYQNHTKETKQSMYAARVEMRLAKERVEVLKIFSALEKAAREAKDGVDINVGFTPEKSLAMNCEGNDRKRKR